MVDEIFVDRLLCLPVHFKHKWTFLQLHKKKIYINHIKYNIYNARLLVAPLRFLTGDIVRVINERVLLILLDHKKR